MSIPAGSGRPGAATGGGLPCGAPEALSHLGPSAWRGEPPGGSSPPTFCPRELQFPTCPSSFRTFFQFASTPFPLPPIPSFCTSSASSLVLRAPGAETRTLGHLLSSDRRVFGFDCPSIPKWRNTPLCSGGWGWGEGELGVAGAPEPELTPLPPPRQSARRGRSL